MATTGAARDVRARAIGTRQKTIDGEDQCMKINLASIGLFVILATNGAAAPAEIAIPNLGVNCATTGGQLCGPPFSVAVTTTAQKTLLKLKYDVHPIHCSAVRLHIFVDGMLIKTTEFLGWRLAPSPFEDLPLSTGVLPLRTVRAGTHIVSVQAEGRSGGCNSGGLARWRGSLQLQP